MSADAATTPPAPPRARSVVGTAATEDSAGVDYAVLRAARRQAVLEAMADAGIDALVLGRYPNIKYVVGHRSLWRAVLTASAPVCVLMGDSGGTWLQAATWEDGIPPEVPRDHLTGLTWNPRTVVEALKAVPGLEGVRRIGVDGVPPSGDHLFTVLSPDAEVVDAQPLLDAVRRRRFDDEVHCLRTALAIAEGALAAMGPHLAPGASERSLKGRAAAAALALAPVLLGSEPAACATPRVLDARAGALGTVPLRLTPGDRTLAPGDQVALRMEVLHNGYLGTVARTRTVGGPTAAGQALHERWRRATAAVVDRCRAGTATGALVAAWDATGEARPPVPLVTGVGHGVETPVVPGALGPAPAGDDVLAAGMTLCVQGYVWEPGVGGHLGSETVVVGEGPPQLLTRAAGGLAGGG